MNLNYLLKVCVDEGEPILKIPCGKEKPNCVSRVNGDICARNKESHDQCPAVLPPPEPSFLCTSTGYFPDPTRCNIYHICSRNPEGKLEHSDYACPNGYYYQSDKKLCRRQLIARECTRREISCADNDGDDNELTLYTPNKQFYYYCPVGEKKPIVFRCPDNSEFNSFENGCKYKCRKQGNFPHSDNPRLFFVCFIESAIYLSSKIEECPEGYIFDGKLKQCVCNSGKCLEYFLLNKNQ